MKMPLVVALTLVGVLPSLGMSQDTARTARKVDKRLMLRWDTVRFATDSTRWTIFRDSVRWIPRDSMRRVVTKDSVRFALAKDSAWRFFAGARQDPARPQGGRRGGGAPVEYSSTTTPALQNQNGNAGFAQHLFPPELVMQHQSRLKLTEQQRTAIVQEINRLQATAVNVQWRVADESEKLSELLSQDAVAETAALEQVNKVIEYETAVKRAQLSMLIRIRNVLTAEQRAILRNLPKPAK